MPFALLNPRILVWLALVASLSGLCWWGYNMVYDRGAQSVQSKWDAEKKEQAEQSVKVALDALTVTKSLQDSANQQQKVSNAQISKLNASLDSALARLRERPARSDPGNMPSSTGAGTSTGCTGAELYRDDGQFLAWYARNTAELKQRLDTCQVQYKTVYDALNKPAK